MVYYEYIERYEEFQLFVGSFKTSIEIRLLKVIWQQATSLGRIIYGSGLERWSTACEDIATLVATMNATWRRMKLPRLSPTLPFPWGLQIPSNTWYLWPIGVSTPNGISLVLTFSCGALGREELTKHWHTQTDRQRDRQSYVRHLSQ